MYSSSVRFVCGLRRDVFQFTRVGEVGISISNCADKTRFVRGLRRDRECSLLFLSVRLKSDSKVVIKG